MVVGAVDIVSGLLGRVSQMGGVRGETAERTRPHASGKWFIVDWCEGW